MAITASPIRTAVASEEESVIATLALAFGADPIIRWAYPDPHRYLTHFPAFVRAFAGRAFENGTAHYVDGYAGAALWLPPDVGPDEETMGGLLEQTVQGDNKEAVFSIIEQMGGYHPNVPHWYLPLIGVEPAWQGKGLGTALLGHALAQCDREHQTAYLESSNAANIPLYQRHGFTVIGEIQAGTSPAIWPMLRRPQAL